MRKKAGRSKDRVIQQGEPTPWSDLDDLPVSLLKELLRLDAERGVLSWKVRVSQRVRVGDEITCTLDGKRRVFRLFGRMYLASRVIFAMANGRWPKGFIDHKNVDPTDDRPCNLREATPTQNVANTFVRSTNELGIKGVMRARTGRNGIVRRHDRFHARITVNGKMLHLGTFACVESASDAYEAAAKKYFGEYARRGQ